MPIPKKDWNRFFGGIILAAAWSSATWGWMDYLRHQAPSEQNLPGVYFIAKALNDFGLVLWAEVIIRAVFSWKEWTKP